MDGLSHVKFSSSSIATKQVQTLYTGVQILPPLSGPISSLIIPYAFIILKQNYIHSLFSVFCCSFLTTWLSSCCTFNRGQPLPLTLSLHPSSLPSKSCHILLPLCSPNTATAVWILSLVSTPFQ